LPKFNKGRLMERIIIIGGLSAGPSAAAKARRENEKAEIILFEKGENISYATCGMPYAFSGIIENRSDLIVVKPDLMRTRFKIDVKVNEEIVSIDTDNKIVYSVKGKYSYDKLIFASGAKSVVPPIKNINKATNWSTCRSMTDFDKITKEGLTSKSKHITIIGAGLIGIEVAENLREAGKEVTLIEGADQILTMWNPKFGIFAETILKNNGIEVITSGIVSEFELDEKGKISGVKIEGKATRKTDFVILSVGIKPNTELLVKIGADHIHNGALKVNERMETSIKDVYAAGDNVSIKNLQTNEYDYFPLGTHSNKGGRAAGANAAGKDIVFKGAYKTAIVKVFDYTLARTGLNPKALTELAIPFETVLTIAGSTPSYYPGQKDLITEIYYNPINEEILGAELFGKVGVDKRVDVLSTAIYAKLKISDLSQLDLAYAPPFSPAKDPVVVTSFVAENMLDNKTIQMSVEELDAYLSKTNPKDFLLLDVRTPKEFEEGTIQNAMNIPLDEIRNHIDFIKDQNKPIVIFCRRGLRGYLAELILKHHHIKDMVNVAGGITVWQMYGGLVLKPKEVEA
jgi:NADPH-dependent 2,4-dienoyl-CoA reductase/sulfur reductase-like enzyme/rhodanese-related sulfurtransferase